MVAVVVASKDKSQAIVYVAPPDVPVQVKPPLPRSRQVEEGNFLARVSWHRRMGIARRPAPRNGCHWDVRMRIAARADIAIDVDADLDPDPAPARGALVM